MPVFTGAHAALRTTQPFSVAVAALTNSRAIYSVRLTSARQHQQQTDEQRATSNEQQHKREGGGGLGAGTKAIRQQQQKVYIILHIAKRYGVRCVTRCVKCFFFVRSLARCQYMLHINIVENLGDKSALSKLTLTLMWPDLFCVEMHRLALV